jgi:hypothetical protein
MMMMMMMIIIILIIINISITTRTMESVYKLLIFAKMIELAKLTQNKSLFITLLIPHREIPGRPTDGQSNRHILFASVILVNDMKQLVNKFRVSKF